MYEELNKKLALSESQSTEEEHNHKREALRNAREQKSTTPRGNLFHGEVYSIQHYVIKFLSDLRQIGGFLRVLRFLHK
jgi:hypothetical protein